jgi:beta-fructofuranosidase
MTADPHRPRYHFTTDNWMNDPIPFYADGVYHLYFQHNPGAAVWGDMHWGHAVSRDLVRWEKQSIAIAPTPGSCDQDGIFTGCVTRDGAGRFAALYTGIPHLKPFRQVQCLATSDALETWTKYPGNPIIAEKPEGAYGDCFRDPQVFETGDGERYLVVGGEKADGSGGAAFLYRALSGDLARWDYLHPLFEGDTATGHDFECPDLFRIGDDRYLFISSRGKTWWHVGRLGDDLRFTREAYGACDDGNYYAAKTLIDGQGRRLLFGWITEARPEAEQVAAGWSGGLSLPRVVSLGDDGTPRFTPAQELTALRGARHRFEGRLATDEAELGTFGNALEVDARFGHVADGASLTLHLGESNETLALTVPPGDAETHLHFFVDRSVVEVFTNGRACHTYRIYPRQPGTVRVTAQAPGNGTSLHADVWELTS